MTAPSGPSHPLPRTFVIVTLGCKLNQFDGASLGAQLRARGFREAGAGEAAGVVVVNTCTVTANADRQARQLARRGRREHPGCRLLVTGCYAERDRDGLLRAAEIDDVIGLSDRHRIPAILDRLAAEAAPASREIACIDAAGGDAAGPLYFGDHTRAFLKVQEGCNLSCAYCIIPAVRGASRSIAPELLEGKVAALAARGYQEIVLTGVNTGDYGRDLTPRMTLGALLRRLVRVPGLGRLRLNSLEPRTVTPEIVEIFDGEPRLAKHLQIPLQSGCDATLRRMHRNYRTDDYRRTLDALRERVAGIGLGADVIAGFPGETPEEFDQTLAFIATSPLNYLHVFSYSDRPGTPSSSMAGHIAPGEIRDRSYRLRALGEELGLAFRRSFLGTTLEILGLAKRRPDGRLRALSSNFIEMGLDAGDEAMNRILQARVIRADDGDILAIPADAAVAFEQIRTQGSGRALPAAICQPPLTH